MNLKRILGYAFVFSLATVICFIGVSFFLAFVIGALMFVTWSLPVALPFTWTVFRIVLLISVFIATLFCFSDQGLELVDDFEEDDFE